MKLLNIYCLVQEFYAIEAISALLSSNHDSNLEPMRHSHSRWYCDFCDFRDTYILKFASAIYDYTILVVAAELRIADLKPPSIYRTITRRTSQEMTSIVIAPYTTKAIF